jgi:hypothetical protein
MKHVKRLTPVAMVIVALIVWGLTRGTEPVDADTPGNVKPATVEHIEGSDLSRVTLSQRAFERLEIQTATVRDEQIDGAAKKVIPYSAVVYDATGAAWTYTSPEPLIYVRHAIAIDRIEGDLAILADGPATDVNVVTVGAAELYGTEFGVGH